MKKFAVLGFGRMGSWFAEIFSAVGEVLVIDPSSDARARCAFASAASPEALEAFRPDFVLNAAPLRITESVFEAALPFLSKTTVIADMTSVKAGLETFYAKAARPFLSFHPMFGPTFARRNELEGHHMILIQGSDARAAALLEGLLAKSRVSSTWMSFVEHDEMMAYSLTTPFVLSLVFGGCIKETVVPGTTFKKHLEIARGLLSEDDELISEILLNPTSDKQIGVITGRLEYLRNILRSKDREELVKFLNWSRKHLTPAAS